MKSLKEIFNQSGSIQEMAEKAKNRLIENRYIFNPVFGWEKPETLEAFQLDPNMEAIPSETRFDNDLGHSCKGPTAQWLKYQDYKTKKSKADYFEYKNSERAVDNFESY